MVPSRRVSTCRSLPDSRRGYKLPSLYDHVHLVTGHPNPTTMSWHQENSINAGYTPKDAAVSRSRLVCTRLVATAIDSIDPSLLLLFPANSSLSMLRHILVTHFVDICIVTYSSSSPQGVYTKNRSASEHVDKLSVFFTFHPSWQNQFENVDRLIRIDPERNFRSEAFLTVAASFGSRLERLWCC